MTRGPRGRPSERGQASVELAVLLPVVVVLLLLVIQVALVARDVVLVAHAAREAARAAAVEPDAAVARRAALRSGGLDPHDLDVSVQPRSTTVRVTVTYRIPTALPLIGRLLRDPVTHTTVAMRREDLKARRLETDTKRTIQHNPPEILVSDPFRGRIGVPDGEAWVVRKTARAPGMRPSAHVGP